MPKPPKTAVAAKQPPVGRPGAGRAKASRRTKATPSPGDETDPTAMNSATTAADRFLDEQRALLLSEREASLRQAESLRAEAEQLAEEMEPGDTQFDEESGEGATLNVERERDLALSAQARATADEVNLALAKLDKGTYGTCERCARPIPRARLKAMPSAALCVACKSGGLSRR